MPHTRLFKSPLLIVAAVLAAFFLLSPPAPAAAGFHQTVTVSVSAEPPVAGTWSSWLEAQTPDNDGYVMLSITTAGSTMTLQYSIDGGTTAYDYDTYTATGAWVIHSPVPGWLWRIGVAQSDWSAAAAGSISR